MTYDFKPNKYHNGEQAVVIDLTRKQVLQMAEMVEKFSEVENFELHIDRSSGSNQITFKFTLELAGNKNERT